MAGSRSPEVPHDQMNKNTKRIIMDNARAYLKSGWHCSEGVLKAVGDYYLDEITPQALRMSTPFAGGVGSTHDGICGALSGGLMVIGALYGRTELEGNDDHCKHIAAVFYQKFLTKFNDVRCADLKENWVEKVGNGDCAELAAQTAGLLIEVLEREQK